MIPSAPNILGLAAIISLLPLGFLFRLAFWLGIVVLLLASAPSPQVPLKMFQLGNETQTPSRPQGGAFSSATLQQRPSHGTLTAEDLAVPWRGARDTTVNTLRASSSIRYGSRAALN
jgi:hypothetical protein